MVPKKEYELLHKNEQSKMNWNSLVERKGVGVLALKIPGFLLFKYLSSSYPSEAKGALPQAHMDFSLPHSAFEALFYGILRRKDSVTKECKHFGHVRQVCKARRKDVSPSAGACCPLVWTEIQSRSTHFPVNLFRYKIQFYETREYVLLSCNITAEIYQK